MYKPLADKIRPTTLDDVVGQRHILAEGGILRRIIESGSIPNMIFYGPSGVGKTTLAQIIAATTRRKLYRLNATTASTADIRAMAGELDTLLAPQGILLYLDEIQYFNKKQQQSLLEFIENGSITLIASTTENPYFYVYNAILSRSTIFEFKPITAEDVARAVTRAFTLCARDMEAQIRLEDGVDQYIAAHCGGDVRKAINAAELLCAASPCRDGVIAVALADAKLVTQGSRHDRDGDSHYDVLSAFHKSLRGSDPDAALHYLARLLVGGDLQSAIRRLLVVASEDVGMAYPQAALIVKACCDNALQLGLPEGAHALGQAAVLLATAPKSSAASQGIFAAMADVQAGRGGEIPGHLRDANYAGAQRLGRGEDYLYPHDYKNHYVAQQYLPDDLMSARYYQPGPSKVEQQAVEYWRRIKNES